MAEHPSDEWPSAAAIEVDGQVDVDALLAAVTDRLRRSGWRVRGLLMTYPEEGEGCARPMVLVDVDSREPYLVSQPLGRDSRACRADPQGFARASSVLWATHLVEEAEAADRVLVLHKGQLLADGTPADVAATLGGGTLEEAFIRATT